MKMLYFFETLHFFFDNFFEWRVFCYDLDYLNEIRIFIIFVIGVKGTTNSFCTFVWAQLFWHPAPLNSPNYLLPLPTTALILLWQEEHLKNTNTLFSEQQLNIQGSNSL